MPAIDRETLNTMRHQLAEDRALCDNSSLAQKYLDDCENIQHTLAAELVASNPEDVSEICTDAEKRIGSDNVTAAELESMAADLARWDEEIDAIPESEHGTASYRAAREFFRILKANYVVLIRKKELQSLVPQKFGPAN